MIPLMKEIEVNCAQVNEAVAQIVKNGVIVEKTITDIYNFIQRNKNQVSYMKPIIEMLSTVTAPQNEKFINDVRQSYNDDEYSMGFKDWIMMSLLGF